MAMKAIKVSEDKYEINIFDFVDLCDDYVCGHVKRQPDSGEDSELQWWMFYPTTTKPLSAGNLKKIRDFIVRLNTGG